jgi:Ca-activated chloride channel family protein
MVCWLRTLHDASLIRRFAVVSVLALIAIGVAPARADDFARGNNKGNSLVKEGKLDEALQTYQETAVEHPDKPELDYNMANVYHMKGVFDTAATEYKDALASATSPVAPDAYYNLGNTLFRMGQYGPAAEAYKRTLIENPDDREAKFNLEVALKRLQSDSTQQNQKKKDQEQEPDSSNQDQQDQQQKSDQDKKDQDSTSQQQNQNQEQKPDSSDAQQQPKEPNDQQQADQQQQQQAPQQVGMTKEDAERILDALKNNELDVQKQRALRVAVPAIAKDW